MDPRYPGRDVQHRLRRHFWIRPDGDAADELLSEFLEKRGVVSVPIGGWDTGSFRELMDHCFGP